MQQHSFYHYHAKIFVLKITFYLLYNSNALQNTLTIEENAMNSDQTTQSGSIEFPIKATKVHREQITMVKPEKMVRGVGHSLPRAPRGEERLKVRKRAKIRNRYNQTLHLTQEGRIYKY